MPKQLQWRADGDARLAHGRSRVRVPALASELHGIFSLLFLPSPWGDFAPSPPPTPVGRLGLNSGHKLISNLPTILSHKNDLTAGPPVLTGGL